MCAHLTFTTLRFATSLVSCDWLSLVGLFSIAFRLQWFSQSFGSLGVLCKYDKWQPNKCKSNECKSFAQDPEIQRLKETYEADQQPIHVAGDGKFDSPGFRARFCTYFVQCLNTMKVIGLWTAVKFQVTNWYLWNTSYCQELGKSSLDVIVFSLKFS